MKRLAFILSFVVIITALALCGCTRDGKMSSSVRSLPNIISSAPVPSMPDYFGSSSIPMSSQQVKPAMSADFSEIGTLPNSPILWGPGTRLDSEKRSEACVGLQNRFSKYDANFIMPNEKKIYLTFDEGYENGYTPKILDTLKEKNVKAVFFITGHYAKSSPEIVQRMIDEGHTLGNHSFDHLNAATSSLETAYNDTKKIHDYVEEHFSYSMSLFRYPEGTFNEQTLKMHQQMGYKTVFWSFAYTDWDPKNQMGEAASLKRLTDGLQPGSIVLMHTVGSDNAAVLGRFIDNAKSAGYSIELLS